MLSCSLLEKSDWKRYDALVRVSPHGSIFSLSGWETDEVAGVFKGHELIGGAAYRCTELCMARYVDFTPWQGIVARSTSETENIAIAESIIKFLRPRFDELTFTLHPAWTDIRIFTWEGFRAHIRYTYRGYGSYEKRVKVPDTPPENGRIGLLEDWACVYYWKANEGGEHTYWLDKAVKYANNKGKEFDMVGCNSPHRGLFKRGFGGRLTPYYAVTTSEARDLRAVPVSPLRTHEESVFYMPEAGGGREREANVAARRHHPIQGGQSDAVSGVRASASHHP